jgi:PAT family beta-lactamase induction signal transducer AmpG
MNNFFYYKSHFGSLFASASNDEEVSFNVGFRKEQQSFFLGIQHILSAFHAYWKWFNRDHRWLFGTSGDKQKAWSYTMIIVGLIMAGSTTLHYYFLRQERKQNYQQTNRIRPKSELWGCFQFFKRNRLGWL